MGEYKNYDVRNQLKENFHHKKFSQQYFKCPLSLNKII